MTFLCVFLYSEQKLLKFEMLTYDGRSVRLIWLVTTCPTLYSGITNSRKHDCSALNLHYL